MANIAIIPARAGSKRLPNKNIMPLCGKPLIAWTIDAALDSKCFDIVLVSTDDAKIANIAYDNGASVPFLRPSALAGDCATSDAVIKHALDWLEINENVVADTVCLLQPTSPLREARHIVESWELLNRHGCEGIVSVAVCPTSIELCNYLPEDNCLASFLKEVPVRTQEMKTLYQLNGAIYMYNSRKIRSLRELYREGSSAKAYVMEQKNSVDIDTLLDFQWAEFLLRKKTGFQDIK